MSVQSVDRWASAEFYDVYMGRWSRAVAREFLPWLDVRPDRVWGDVGCGTGVLVDAIRDSARPGAIFAIDRSADFVAHVSRRVDDPRVRVDVADAVSLPWASGSCDAVVSGLVLNFVGDAVAAVREMARVARAGAPVGVYVWDYARGMTMLRSFWDAALDVRPQAESQDEAARFPLCRPERLEAVFHEAGLASVTSRAIDVPTVFRSFDDYWTPFLGGQGPAPSFLASLDEVTRERIRTVLTGRLVPAADGTIPLVARAWAVRGTAR